MFSPSTDAAEARDAPDEKTSASISVESQRMRPPVLVIDSIVEKPTDN